MRERIGTNRAYFSLVWQITATSGKPAFDATVGKEALLFPAHELAAAVHDLTTEKPWGQRAGNERQPSNPSSLIPHPSSLIPPPPLSFTHD